MSAFIPTSLPFWLAPTATPYEFDGAVMQLQLGLEGLEGEFAGFLKTVLNTQQTTPLSRSDLRKLLIQLWDHPEAIRVFTAAMTQAQAGWVSPVQRRFAENPAVYLASVVGRRREEPILTGVSATGPAVMPPPTSGIDVHHSLPRLGKAAALLKLLDSPKATFILTDKCNLACPHCFAPHGMGELEPQMVRAVIDELEGLPEIYFSGGEPFLYQSGGQAFLDVVRYAAERVGRVFIATNGSFLPDNEAEAKTILSRFPENTTFILSADLYHAEALDRRGRSLAEISRIFYTAAEATKHGFELFVRYPLRQQRAVEERTAAIVGRDIYAKLQREGRVHINAVHRQNAARLLPGGDTKPVELNDFVEHSFRLGELGIFINQRGEVTDNSHAAYIKRPPPFALLGNIHKVKLNDIIIDQLLPGRFYEKEKVLARLKQIIGNRALFADGELNHIADSVIRPHRRVPLEAISRMVGDPDFGISWRIDHRKNHLYLGALYNMLGKEVVLSALKRAMRQYIKMLFSTDSFPHYEPLEFPQMSVLFEDDDVLNSISLGQFEDEGSTPESILRDFFALWTKELWAHGIPKTMTNELVYRPLYDALMENRTHFRRYRHALFLIRLLGIMRNMLGIQKNPADAIKETFWFQSLKRE